MTIPLAKGLVAATLILVGGFLVFASYKLFEIGERKAHVQQGGSLVKMSIVGRVQGLGTLKSPNEIYVSHQQKKYLLLTSKKHFKQTALLDSIEVKFDPVEDIAVLPTIKATGPYGLLIAVALCGLSSVGGGLVYLLRKDL